MAKQDTYSHWRDSARTPKFFVADARGVFALLLLLFYPRWYTLIIAVVVFSGLAVLNYLHIPLMVAARLARGYLSGPRKHIRL